MTPKPLWAIFVSSLIFPSLVPFAPAAVTYKENLHDCKLPHGEITLPLAAAAPQGQGDLLKFSDGSLTILPGTGGDKPLDRNQLAESLRAKNTGDLQFLPDDSGTFWAVSGRIVDAGNRYLYEAAALKMDRPALIPGNAKHPPGFHPEVQEGRTYLLETTDAHYALLRVLDITKTSILLQYVYQPSGLIDFDVKETDLLELKPDPAAAPSPASPDLDVPPETPVIKPPPAIGPLGVVGTTGAPGEVVIHIGPNTPPAAPTVLEPYLATHLRQRELLIQTRLKTLRAPATTPAEINKKIAAISDLVALRAGEEAAPVLVDQISFLNPKGEGQEFTDSVHPCFAALKQMGKPASDAAVKALRRLDPAATSVDSLQDPAYRAGLLALVIRAVEGDTVGEFILRRERDAATTPARRTFYDQLLNPHK